MKPFDFRYISVYLNGLLVYSLLPYIYIYIYIYIIFIYLFAFIFIHVYSQT